MVIDALRAYVQLASGLTEVTRERAKSAAKALVAQAGSLGDTPADSAAQVRALADELAKTARGNRDIVLGMVRTEAERAVASLGVASADDVAVLQRQLAALDSRLAALSGQVETAAGGVESSSGDDSEFTSSTKKDMSSKTAEPDVPADPEVSADPAMPTDAEASAGPDIGEIATDADDVHDIPTPTAVKKVIAKKNATRKRAAKPRPSAAPDEPGSAASTGDSDDDPPETSPVTVGSDSDTMSADSTQDPPPPDVSRT